MPGLQEHRFLASATQNSALRATKPFGDDGVDFQLSKLAGGQHAPTKAEGTEYSLSSHTTSKH